MSLRLAGLLLSLLSWPAIGLAGGEAQFAMPADARYVGECGSCHTAYAPALLPAAAWRQVFGSLDRHYGMDASLDAKTRDGLLAAVLPLATEPGARPRYGTMTATAEALDFTRISLSPLFRYVHDEMPAYVWARKGVLSRAQCGNCHRRADEGRYFEREVRIPQQ